MKAAEDMQEKKLHILFVSGIEERGGAANALFEVCRGLIESGNFECTALVSQDSAFRAKLESAGVKTIVTHHGSFLVPMPNEKWKAPVKYLVFLSKYLFGRLVAVRTVKKYVDMTSVDIIHSNVPRVDLGIILARKYHIPHFCHLRECSFSHFKCWSYRYNPVGYLNSGSDRLIAISDSVAEHWKRWGITEDKLIRIYDGVQIPKTKRLHNYSNANKVTYKCIFLGGYVQAKGIWDAIYAVSQISRGTDYSVTLDIYGGGSDGLKSQVTKYIGANGLGNIIHTYGEIDDVWNVIPAYDYGLACSEDEAFGRTVIEYQACGVIPIVSSSGAYVELVSDKINGYIYNKVEGSSDLACTIQKAIDNAEINETISKRAVINSERYTAKSNCESIGQTYLRFLAQRYA